MKFVIALGKQEVVEIKEKHLRKRKFNEGEFSVTSGFREALTDES